MGILQHVADWPLPPGGRRVTLPVKAGACRWQETALELSGPAPLLLELQAGEEDGILELRELHRRADPVFAYTVEWEGERLYFRDYEPLADAPVSVFIRLPRPVSGGAVRLCIRPETGTPRFAGAALHGRSLLEGEGPPMRLGFFTPRLTGEEEADCRVLAQLNEAMASCRHLRPMVGFEIPYMNRSDEEILQMTSRWLRLCGKEGLPVFLNLNTWWGGTPSGPDGEGGYFGDMEYQQVVYVPQTGERRLTVPNMWSNTPWYTMNHETLNRVRRERLRRCVQLIRRAAVAENPDGLPDIWLFLDNEPTYWAAFAYTENADSGGDVSEALLRAAQRDGVSFPQAGPWGERQRQWLLDNLTTYMDGLAGACLEETGRTAVRVEDGRAGTADRMLAEHTYTHVFPFATYPYMDLRHPQWETHVTPAARLGLEGSTWEDPRILDYAIGFGRLANVNAERACYREPSFHCQYYMYGADASMIFNYRPEDPAEMCRVDRLLDEKKAPERDYPLPLVFLDVFRDGLEHPAVVKSLRLAVRSYRQRRVLQPTEPGSGLLVLDAGEAGRYGGCLTLELWAFVHPENGGIRALLGASPDTLHPVCQLPTHAGEGESFLTDLPLEGFEPEQRVYLGLEITSVTFEADWSLLNYIWSIRLMRRHSARAGHADGFVFSTLQKRRLSRLVMERADFRRLAESCPPSVRLPDEEAAAGGYGSACRRINAAWAAEAAEEYWVVNEGPLGDTGLYARTSRPVLLKRKARAQGGFRLTAEGEPGTVVRLEGTAAQREDTGWLLYPGKEAALVLEEGPDTVLEGRFRGLRGGRIRIQSQRLERYRFQPYIDVPLAQDAELLVQEDEDAPLHPADRGSLPADARIWALCRQGWIRQARFTPGICRGRVAGVRLPSFLPPADNGFIVLDTSAGPKRFEMGPDCRLAYPDAPAARVLLCPGCDPGLRPGRELRIRYCPYRTHGRPPRVLEIDAT